MRFAKNLIGSLLWTVPLSLLSILAVPQSATAQYYCYTCDYVYYPGNGCYLASCVGTDDPASADCSQSGDCAENECNAWGKCMFALSSDGMVDAPSFDGMTAEAIASMMSASPESSEALRRSCDGAIIAKVYTDEEEDAIRKRSRKIVIQ